MLKVFLLYFCLQNNKCVSYIANSKNNINFEIIKVIHNSETAYVCILYYLTRIFIHSLKNGVLLFSDIKKLYDFSL